MHLRGNWGHFRITESHPYRDTDNVLYWAWEDRDPEPEEELYYGDFQESRTKEDGAWCMPDILQSSDYSGGTVELSNYQVFMRDFGGRPGVHGVYGGHGTRAIALSPVALADPEIREVLEGLEDYPLVDEEHLSMLESELSDEAWDSWVRRDFEAEMCECLNLLLDDDLTVCPTCALDDADLRELFERAREKDNIYWEAEGTSMTIRVGSVVEAARILLAEEAEGTTK